MGHHVTCVLATCIFYCSCSAAQRRKCGDLSRTASQALSTGYYDLPFLFLPFPSFLLLLLCSPDLCSSPQHVIKNRYAVLSFLLAVGEEAGSQHTHSIPSQVCIANHNILLHLPLYILSFPPSSPSHPLSLSHTLPPSLPPSLSCRVRYC